jgi:cyanophycinase
VLDDAAGVFFSGGDQLRITSQIGDSGIEAKVRALFERGGVIAGTSAGASVMSETMMVEGTSKETHRIGDLHMAPGLGLIRDVIIDQHFAERGRFGRLIGAVAHNPRVLGLGVDENTAVIVEQDRLSVIGVGAAYVVDGSSVTYSNLAEAQLDVTLSMHNVTVHVLAEGDSFDLRSRHPTPRGR